MSEQKLETKAKNRFILIASVFICGIIFATVIRPDSLAMNFLEWLVIKLEVPSCVSQAGEINNGQ